MLKITHLPRDLLSFTHRHHFEVAELSNAMKFLYPASNSASGLTPPQLALKIARHSPCASCSSCYGLHPPLGTEVVPDDQQAVQSTLVDQYGSDDEDDMQLPYLEYCGCGHFSSAHGANELELGSEEFARRGRVAIRLDELLQV